MIIIKFCSSLNNFLKAYQIYHVYVEPNTHDPNSKMDHCLPVSCYTPENMDCLALKRVYFPLLFGCKNWQQVGKHTRRFNRRHCKINKQIKILFIFHERLYISKPLDKFDSMLVHHIFMQRVQKFYYLPPLPPKNYTTHGDCLQELPKSLLKFRIQIPEIIQANNHISKLPTETKFAKQSNKGNRKHEPHLNQVPIHVRPRQHTVTSK